MRATCAADKRVDYAGYIGQFCDDVWTYILEIKLGSRPNRSVNREFVHLCHSSVHGISWDVSCDA